MDAIASFASMEEERASLLEEAAEIVAAAYATGRELTAEEDSHVLTLMTRVRILEGEVSHWKRHHSRTFDCANPVRLTKQESVDHAHT